MKTMLKVKDVDGNLKSEAETRLAKLNEFIKHQVAESSATTGKREYHTFAGFNFSGDNRQDYESPLVADFVPSTIAGNTGIPTAGTTPPDTPDLS